MKIILQDVCWITASSKNQYRLIAIGLRRQKELDANPKTIQQIYIIG